jgi:hypothetical protein
MAYMEKESAMKIGEPTLVRLVAPNNSAVWIDPAKVYEIHAAGGDLAACSVVCYVGGCSPRIVLGTPDDVVLALKGHASFEGEEATAALALALPTAAGSEGWAGGRLDLRWADPAAGRAAFEGMVKALDPRPNAFDAQVDRIVRGFLLPACQYRPPEGEKFDAHARWKPVNLAAGVIAGWVTSFDSELVDQARLAQHLTDACQEALLAAELEEEFWPVRLKIAGPKGLPTRVGEALVRMGVGA